MERKAQSVKERCIEQSHRKTVFLSTKASAEACISSLNQLRLHKLDQSVTMSHLKEGDLAPAFSATKEKGQTVNLSDYKGKKLVLYFYPKDDTPGCTAESCSLRDGYPRFQAQGYEILGVSPDSVKKHVKFQEKYNLPFNLLADEDHAVAAACGVWGAKKFRGRA